MFGDRENRFRFDVNPDHSHLIIYDDVTDKDMDLNDSISYDEFRNRTEFLFTKRLTYYRKNQFDEGCF